MWTIFKTEMLIYHSKPYLEEKILFGKVTHLQEPNIRKMSARDMFRNENSMFDSGPSITCCQNHCKLLFSETDNCIEFKFQCQINHGPEKDLEFSVPIQTPDRNFSNF